MITLRSPLKRLAIVVGLCVAMLITVMAATLAAPDRSIARAGELAQAQPTPPPPPRLDPPIVTPRPGAAQIEASVAGSTSGNDLEVVRFRPDLSLRKNETPPNFSLAAEKPTSLNSQFSSDQAIGSQGAYQAPNIEGTMRALDWVPVAYEGFEGIFPSAPWNLYDFSDDGFDRTWGTTNFDFYAGQKSAWPAAGGSNKLDPTVTRTYTDNLESWMDYGPFDFSTMSDVFVSFGLYYNTEPDFDWVYFCASVDGINYNCDYWSGYSGGWTDQAYWLSAYAGYPQVWLAWVFTSDASNFDFIGPFVDEIYVWADDITVTPTPEPGCSLSGQLVQNCSFETGNLQPWASISTPGASAPQANIDQRVQLPAERVERKLDGIQLSPIGPNSPSVVTVTGDTAVEGKYSAYLWQPNIGNDFLFQTLDVPIGTTDIVLDFWFGVTTLETQFDADWFCVSLAAPGTHAILVDLGCMDAAYTTGYWQEVLYTLNASEAGLIAGSPVDIVFELYNRGGSGGTAAYIDFVRVYAAGGSGVPSIDPNEPNDDPLSNATRLTCGQTISGTIGDALGSYGDVDWFSLSGVPLGQIDIDIDADTKVPPSALDSVVGLHDIDFIQVAANDDDGLSYDSYITYTNLISGYPYYVRVESYSGYGGPDSFYDLTVQCADAGNGPPPPGVDRTPPATNTWTIMLYLNGEDLNFAPILQGYIHNMQSVLVGKTSYMTVAVLYDGPEPGDSVRYLLQPNGAYVDGVNRWPMGELNMGDPHTLAGFANWALDQFPAQNTYLAIDDHGHGVFGISWDETDGNDNLTPPEVYSALKDITHNGDPGRKIDIFDYEACLMGMAENAFDVKDWADFVVFSEQISWGLNTYPAYFSDLAATDMPLTVGQRIINRYHAAANADSKPHTISLIDTRQMDAVKLAVTNFGDALQATGNVTSVLAARNASQAFAADLDATNPAYADYIDLWDLANVADSQLPLSATIATAVKAAVDAAVISEAHSSGMVDTFFWDHTNAHGLSIYYPPGNASSAFHDYTAPRLFQMSTDDDGISGRWDEFLLWGVGPGGATSGNGVGGDRKGMNGSRFLQPKQGGGSLVYLPLIRK